MHRSKQCLRALGSAFPVKIPTVTVLVCQLGADRGRPMMFAARWRDRKSQVSLKPIGLPESAPQRPAIPGG